MANRRGKKTEDTAELLNLLTRREALTRAHDEYEEVDKALKARIRGRARDPRGRLADNRQVDRPCSLPGGRRKAVARKDSKEGIGRKRGLMGSPGKVS